jgi:hypothetical protein
VQRLDGRRVQTVALLQPVGDIELTGGAAGPEILRQQAGGGDAVHVVVAVDGHSLAVRQGTADTTHRRLHVRQQQRVLQKLLAGPEKARGGLWVG